MYRVSDGSRDAEEGKSRLRGWGVDTCLGCEASVVEARDRERGRDGDDALGKVISADTFGTSRWSCEEQPRGLDMELRCRNTGRVPSSEAPVPAVASAIIRAGEESG